MVSKPLILPRIWLVGAPWKEVRGCIQKFPDWLPGARTENGTTLCH